VEKPGAKMLVASGQIQLIEIVKFRCKFDPSYQLFCRGEWHQRQLLANQLGIPTIFGLIQDL
jgi:hypothetical protein